ncbi:FkbM family methyltransferase [Chryseobacterium gotjawalense]|uniref:FkbM family methyltransferase n=1 Tax=Chryseobacterium gotjawalense TaxID=3042315 RepID=A0ABY8R9J0_9FLAO|nr:FkbM family methyltransferase [Chryseobacterium sp. wdc7]WHF50506.1 FkbM family methyltransferase [Chryseobacterium sp. wdc7]
MIKKLKKLHQLYKNERYKENILFIENSKTGLSPFEKNKALHYPEFTEGEAVFFGRTFRFSHGPSFIHSVEELFEEEVYRFESNTENPYIIDCGANIGLSILYFKKLFPQSRILAFEPDEKIFNILKENIHVNYKLNDVVINKQAVWTEDTELSFFSEGALAGSSVVDFGKKNNIIKVQAIDLKKHLQEPVDFLKIDIEGAENVLIFDIEKELCNVKHLFLEYHGMKDDAQNLHNILELISKVGFRYYIENANIELVQYPFIQESPISFDMQLNIFCRRI